MKLSALPIGITLIILLFSCSPKQKTEHSFYYWKTVFHLSNFEKEYLTNLQITKLYIRFFDVEWDETTSQVIPLATIKFNDSVPQGYKIIPVVYIVNKALKNTKTEDIPLLASKILAQVNHIAKLNSINYPELQIDCDWTETTKNSYFELLRTIKGKLEKDKSLSSTIRLHQVKYKDITGIPPVDRGMLMYYNMGKISAESTHNSVFNVTEAAKYIDHLSD